MVLTGKLLTAAIQRKFSAVKWRMSGVILNAGTSFRLQSFLWRQQPIFTLSSISKRLEFWSVDQISILMMLKILVMVHFLQVINQKAHLVQMYKWFLVLVNHYKQDYGNWIYQKQIPF